MPQAPWILSESSVGVSCTFKNEQAANDAKRIRKCEERRKGRNSVQEVIEEAACIVLNAQACKLHAAGREDIDVRCLGNGRPFALEVIGVKRKVTAQSLTEIMALVNSKKGLNCHGDVQLLCLEETKKATWSSMQKVAEEKDKHYTCVVYSSCQ